jgi:phosphatidylethanolamine/phosphatidyl-N-methylethanolamine N-methyltransferase
MRERKPLPAEWVNLLPRDYMKKWYEEYYSCCVYCNAAGLGQRFMHRSIEHRHDASRHYNRVLEIGANHGEHLQYVQHTFNEYFLTDIESFDKSVLPPSEKRSGLIFQSEDACKLSFPDNHFDRVLCSCVLHHVIDAETALTELRRVLIQKGKADIFLSCDPGFLFRLGRYLGPVREAKKLGLDGVKRLLDARDHRNHVAGLTRLVRHVFRDDEITEKSYPVPYMSWNLSFWKVFNITKK